MTTPYPALFEPLTIGHLRLKNRIMSTSHAPAYAEDGMPKERYRRYHEEKARGGLALSMFGGSSTVSIDSPPPFGQIDIGDDRVVPWLQSFSDTVAKRGRHRNGRRWRRPLGTHGRHRQVRRRDRHLYLQHLLPDAGPGGDGGQVRLGEALSRTRTETARDRFCVPEAPGWRSGGRVARATMRVALRALKTCS